MTVPIHRHGPYLIASAQAALSDAELNQLRDDLVERVGRFQALGAVLDVSAMDVMDSFATRMIRTIAQMCRLRGARMVLVGVQPDVAFAMAQLGLTSRLDGVETAVDLEAGLHVLASKEQPP